MADFHGADVVVEIAFGYDPYDASPVWTDVTADVRSFSYRRGRQYELDRVDGGTATAILSNGDGDFNAHNTAGTYYPNVKPMVPIRIRATYNAVTYQLWRGFVERWPVSFPAQVDSVVTVECADLFKLLALADASADNRTTVVNALSPVAWWRFADTSDETGTGHTLTFAGSPTAGGAAGPWSGDVGTTFDGTDDAATVASESDVERQSLDRSYEFWFKPTGTGPNHWLLDIVGGGARSIGVNLSGDTGFITVHGGSPNVTVSAPITASVWHHLVVSDDLTGSTYARNVYLDGLLVGSASLSDHTGTLTVNIGAFAGSSGFFKGDISEIAVYPTALTATEVAGLYAANFEAFATERTDERIAGLLDNEGYTLQDLQVGQTTMSGANSPAPSTVLEGIQTAADTEFGQFFMAADGQATFHDRHYRLENQDATSGTFGPVNLPYITIIPSMDDERIFNQIKVQPSDAADPFVATDQDSIDSYGRRTLPKTIYPSDTNEGYDAAHHLLALHSEPLTRIEQIQIRLGGDVTLFPVVLGAELGNRYTVKAALTGDDLDQDVYLEAISMSLSADKVWDVTWQLSPATAQAFWTLGVTNLSELDETTVLAY